MIAQLSTSAVEGVAVADALLPVCDGIQSLREPAPLSFHGDLTLRTVLSAAFGVAFFLLGSAITVIAFQGYRRNRSRPMLFIALGFGLIVGSQALAALLILLLALEPRGFSIQATIQLFQLVGMVSILYALRTDA